MGIKDSFTNSPKIRPYLNIGCLFDIPTGSYRPGKHGEQILNGGLAYVTGIGGRGNTYKSTTAHFFVLRVMDRYRKADGIVYDTEISLTIDRLKHLSRWLDFTKQEDLETSDRFVLTDKTVEVGNKWFDKFKTILQERKKNFKNHELTTPFIDDNGQLIKAFNPLLAEIDSFSMMDIEAVERMYDKNEIGESGLNTEALKSAAAKSQLMMQLPGLTGGSGGYVILTAHVGDQHQLDPYAPPAKKLSFLKGKVTFKRVPENFTFLTNNCWYCLSASVLINQTTKAPEFPKDSKEELAGDTDLMIITMQNLRGKAGPTGLPFEIIVSQRDGVHVGLTEFNYIKSHEKFGIGGHDRSYYLELVPDISLQRTTVRSKIDAEPRLQRALEITSELCQMKNLWHHLPSGFVCSPKELYEGLKTKGYDWDILLNTRGYWMFEEDVGPDTKPFLSSMDLLNMYHGTYHPYWLSDDKRTIKGN